MDNEPHIGSFQRISFDENGKMTVDVDHKAIKKHIENGLILDIRFSELKIYLEKLPTIEINEIVDNTNITLKELSTRILNIDYFIEDIERFRLHKSFCESILRKRKIKKLLSENE